MITRLARLCVALAWLAVIAGAASAHEVRPAYFESTETAPQTHDMVWKQPLRGDARLAIAPVLPEDCAREAERRERVAGVLIVRWTSRCALDSGNLRIAGLDRTLSDVFVRIDRLERPRLTAVLRAGADTVNLAPDGARAGIGTYFRIGVDHILSGLDHLLFVVGLMLLVRLRQLVGAISAFTLAHTLTLATSALGAVSLPGPPVEIVIALSIAFLAAEAVKRQQGRETLAARRPWLIAFGFGLIHGFGFAGALSQIGLPEEARLIALLLFNLGVEAGQLLVVAGLLALAGAIGQLGLKHTQMARLGVTYAIGIAGMSWALTRISQTFFA